MLHSKYISTISKYVVAGTLGASLLLSAPSVKADEKENASLQNNVIKKRAMDIPSISSRIQLTQEPLEKYVEKTELYTEIIAMKEKEIDESFGKKLLELYRKVQSDTEDEKIINKIYYDNVLSSLTNKYVRHYDKTKEQISSEMLALAPYLKDSLQFKGTTYTQEEALVKNMEINDHVKRLRKAFAHTPSKFLYSNQTRKYFNVLGTMGHPKTADIARIKLAAEYANMGKAFIDLSYVGLFGLSEIHRDFLSLTGRKVPSGMHVTFVGQKNGSIVEQLRNKYQLDTQAIAKEAAKNEETKELRQYYVQTVNKLVAVMEAHEDKNKFLRYLGNLQASYMDFKDFKVPMHVSDLKEKMEHDLYYYGMLIGMTLTSFGLDYLEGCKDKLSYGYNIQRLKTLSDGYTFGPDKVKEMGKENCMRHFKYMMKHFPQDVMTNQLVSHVVLQNVRLEDPLKKELYTLLRQHYHTILEQTPKYHLIDKVTIDKNKVNKKNNLRIDKYFMDLSKIQLELKEYDHFIEDFKKYSTYGFENFSSIPYYEHALVHHLYHYCKQTKSYDKGYELLSKKGVLSDFEDVIVLHALLKKQNQMTEPLVVAYTSALRMLLASEQKDKEEKLMHHMEHFEKTYSFQLKQGKQMAGELYWLAGEYSEILRNNKKKKELQKFYENYSNNLSIQGVKKNDSTMNYEMVSTIHAQDFLKMYYNLAAVYEYKKEELPQRLIEDIKLLRSRYMNDSLVKKEVEKNQQIKDYYNELVELVKE